MKTFLGKQLDSIRLLAKDIVYSSDYKEHYCTGKPNLEFVNVNIIQTNKDSVMVRCSTCGKVFSLDENPTVGKKIPVLELRRGDTIYFGDFKMHECSGNKKIRHFIGRYKDTETVRIVKCETCNKIYYDDVGYKKWKKANKEAGDYFNLVKDGTKPISSSGTASNRKTLRKGAEPIVRIKQGEELYLIPAKEHSCKGQPFIESIRAQLFDESMQSCLRCKTCGKIFIRSDNYDRVLEYNKKNDNYYNVIRNIRKSRSSVQTKIIRGGKATVSAKDYLIRTTVMHCASRGHELRDITAVVRILKRTGTIEERKIPAAYCKTCDQYYILEADYLKLREAGIPICKVVTIELFQEIQSGVSNLNEESILHSLGYNVNAQENLSESERCSILKVVMDENIMTKAEVLSHLDYLIRRSGNRDSLKIAKSKWEHDRCYVEGYGRSSEITNVKSITRKKYI